MRTKRTDEDTARWPFSRENYKTVSDKRLVFVSTNVISRGRATLARACHVILSAGCILPGSSPRSFLLVSPMSPQRLSSARIFMSRGKITDADEDNDDDRLWSRQKRIQQLAAVTGKHKFGVSVDQQHAILHGCQTRRYASSFGLATLQDRSGLRRVKESSPVNVSRFLSVSSTGICFPMLVTLIWMSHAVLNSASKWNCEFQNCTLRHVRSNIFKPFRRLSPVLMNNGYLCKFIFT